MAEAVESACKRASRMGRMALVVSALAAMAAVAALPASAARPPGVQPITEFPLPVRTSQPVGIVNGNDGGLWFAEQTTDKINRIDPSNGTITEFDSGPGSPSSAAAGPLGSTDIWFTLQYGNAIGRMSATGQLAEPLPIEPGQPGQPHNIVGRERRRDVVHRHHLQQDRPRQP